MEIIRLIGKLTHCCQIYIRCQKTHLFEEKTSFRQLGRSYFRKNFPPIDGWKMLRLLRELCNQVWPSVIAFVAKIQNKKFVLKHTHLGL